MTRPSDAGRRGGGAGQKSGRSTARTDRLSGVLTAGKNRGVGVRGCEVAGCGRHLASPGAISGQRTRLAELASHGAGGVKSLGGIERRPVCSLHSHRREIGGGALWPGGRAMPLAGTTARAWKPGAIGVPPQPPSRASRRLDTACTVSPSSFHNATCIDNFRKSNERL